MELLLSDKKVNSHRIKHFWRVRETVATKRNIGNIGNQGDQKSVVTIVTKVVINIRGFPYEVPVTFVKF